MYPGTKVNWYDESMVENTEITVIENRPLFLLASSFDKGPEDVVRVTGETFYNYYGSKIYFDRHGQAAITAKRIIDAGGELLVKRVVADDATLSNIVLLATLSTTSGQATDDSGNLLYLDADGNQTTEVTDEIVTTSSASISWSAVTIENCYTYDEVVEQAKALYDEDAQVYPIIVITDNGRGDTGKAICISANNELSTTIGKPFYTFTVYEGTTATESTIATFNSTVYNNTNYGVDEYTFEQIKTYVDPTIYSSFLSALATAMGVTVTEADTYNIVDGLTYKGADTDLITIDENSIDLSVSYGVSLSGGSNGEFGISPVGTDAWEEALVSFFSGEYSNEIYDLEEHKIAFVVDCNYPYSVKEAIAQLVTFREDCVFLRDTRMDASTYGECVSALQNFETNNKFIANYMSYYQILDPVTRRRIWVTCLYDMAACLVAAYNRGIHNPTAGYANSFVLESAIEGTVNFVPRITPDVNQKQLMDDLRVNYCIFQSGLCIMQSLYTSQESYTQLSYLNNVMAIQEVVRDVRTTCPKKRYTFVSGGDFSDYASAVQTVLNEYINNFDELSFTYTQDNLLSSQKIFYASIKFAFKDWAQSEIFDVYAIANSTYTTDETDDTTTE